MSSLPLPQMPLLGAIVSCSLGNARATNGEASADAEDGLWCVDPSHPSGLLLLAEEEEKQGRASSLWRCWWGSVLALPQRPMPTMVEIPKNPGVSRLALLCCLPLQQSFLPPLRDSGRAHSPVIVCCRCCCRCFGSRWRPSRIPPWLFPRPVTRSPGGAVLAPVVVPKDTNTAARARSSGRYCRRR